MYCFSTELNRAHCVPNLELNLFAIYLNHACSKLHTDCEIMDGLKSLVCELKKQTRLAHTCRQKCVFLLSVADEKIASEVSC